MPVVCKYCKPWTGRLRETILIIKKIPIANVNFLPEKINTPLKAGLSEEKSSLMPCLRTLHFQMFCFKCTVL